MFKKLIGVLTELGFHCVRVAIHLDLDILANAHLAHAGTAHALESGLHRLALRIEHFRFWGNNDFGLINGFALKTVFIAHRSRGIGECY